MANKKSNTARAIYLLPDNEEYIAPRDAIALILPHVDSELEAKQAIADGLYCKRIKCTAEATWVAEVADVFTAWTPRKQDESYCEHVWMEESIFSQSRQWPQETHLWKWDDGHFVVNHSDEDHDRQMLTYMTGVLLAKNDVLAVVGRSSRVGVGGAPQKEREWLDFWAAFIRIARDGDLAESGSQAALRRKILTMTDDSLSDESIKPVVRAIWKRLKL